VPLGGVLALMTLFAVASEQSKDQNTPPMPVRDSHDQRVRAYRGRACKANFPDGGSPVAKRPNRALHRRGSLRLTALPARRSASRSATLCWKKIRPIGRIVECFLQVRGLLKSDLAETVADFDSLRVACPVLPLRVPSAIRRMCKASRICELSLNHHEHDSQSCLDYRMLVRTGT
jgi:hypothetical protein